MQWRWIGGHALDALDGENVHLHWKSSKFSLALQSEALVNRITRVLFSSPEYGTVNPEILARIYFREWH